MRTLIQTGTPRSTHVHSPGSGHASVSTRRDGCTNINIYDKRQVEFTFEGKTYLHDEKKIVKNSPSIAAPLTTDDRLTLYSQLHHNSRVYNIFVTDIEDVTT